MSTQNDEKRVLQGCCPGSSKNTGEDGKRPPLRSNSSYLLWGVGIGAVWAILYVTLLPMADYLTYSLLNLPPDSAAGASVSFFFYDTAKILLLLVLMVYVIAWLRTGMNVDRVRTYLTGRRQGVGYMLGAGFGAITPFCSCSSIPLFLAFTTAGIPLGITMSFLITSPLVNEVAVVLLWGLLGWKLTLIYVVAGLLAGIIGGWVISVTKAERWLQPYIRQSLHKPFGGGMTPFAPPPSATAPSITWDDRHLFAKNETRTIFKRVWKWVVAGVGVGALLHGYVPQAWIEETLGVGQWWSVPAAVVVGIPLYSNVTGIIPVMESLLLKGLPVGTTLALCMSTVGASLPELMMLKQVMEWRLLALFVGILLVVFTLVGWLLNFANGTLL